ncbi:MAG: hypothetical protein L0Y79_10020 [Chlorobi bacterium]|nr:hypothetical protein [Chlorobiota bacterium]MCI0715205.1 hypothetical protein [Chlorobiota bacterium]
MKITKAALLIIALITVFSGCGRLKQVQQLTEKISGDRLYFCERYVATEIGEGTQFQSGKITVMLKLTKSIGVSEVDINITDLSSGNAVETVPFTVQPGWDYIHFDDVEFSNKGKFKVSCLKKDGTVIASNEVEII